MKTPFIVAEMSANHLGSLERAHAIIDAAADAGADAVKLQCWTPGTMCLTDYRIERGPWAGRRLADLYEEAFLPWEWFPELFARAKQRGLVGFSSVFDTGALAFLESLACPIYKIASFELVDLPLIDAVAETGKPMMLSTGMASCDEINQATMMALSMGCSNLTLLQCTSAYPAAVEDANLASMQNLMRHMMLDDAPWPGTELAVGLSDHSLGHDVAMIATALGASVIEKHLTLSRADGGPDAGFSAEPAEFAALVQAVKRTAAIVGEVRYGCKPGESTDLRRSLYFAQPIRAGEVITRAHLTTARPALGIAPKFMHQAVGARAKHDAQPGDPVTMGSF